MRPATAAVLAFAVTWVFGTITLMILGFDFTGVGTIGFVAGLVLAAIVYRLMGGKPV